MASSARYEPVFSEGLIAHLIQLPRKHQRQVVLLARQLADNPSVRSDYSLADSSGRPFEHLLVGDFVFTYWIDHAVREVRIIDIEEAS